MNTLREMPMLAGIGNIIRWFEELAALLSGPLLTFGLGISLTDLLTDGALLTHQPMLLYAWAVSQAVGVDAQLIGSFDKARQALRERRWLSLMGLLVLGLALGYVAWVSAQVFGVQHAEGFSTAQALAQLGFNQSGWLVQRSLLSVVLVALSGFNRYHPPAQASLEDERAKLERELELEPLRQRVREQRAVGAVGLMRKALNTAVGKDNEQNNGTDKIADSQPNEAQDATFNIEWDRPPTGPGTPTVARPAHKRSRRKPAPVLKLAAPRESVEDKVRRAWRPGMTVQQLVLAAGISHSASSKWRKVLEAERTKATGSMAL